MSIYDDYDHDSWTDEATANIAWLLGGVLYAGCSWTTTEPFKGVADEWIEDIVRLAKPDLYSELRAAYEECDWEQILQRFSDYRLEPRVPSAEPMVVYLSREDDGWTWSVELDGECAECLEVPRDSGSGDYDIHSSTLRTALEAAGYPMGERHWFYNDGDYGPIGEWNRPGELA